MSHSGRPSLLPTQPKKQGESIFATEKPAPSSSTLSKDGFSFQREGDGGKEERGLALTAAHLSNGRSTRFDRGNFTTRWQSALRYVRTRLLAAPAPTASLTNNTDLEFHEVRVPLNTALLAYQNLDGEGIFKTAQQEQREMATGLSSSLISMEKVLNDVLDFNRMEAGKLTWTNKPFNIENVFRSMLLAFRGVASARDIKLETDFDPAIEAFSPILLGDEMRLGQIVANLLSNACKFTQSGTVRCVTKLLHPTPQSLAAHASRRPSADTQIRRRSLQSATLESSPSTITTKEDDIRQDIAIVRIEIIDSGIGIRPRDLVESRLFSAYSQTAAGLRQGGKGSGLGLALVRKIVKLCNGRLGVSSRPGQGSVFWVELALGRPPASEIASYLDARRQEEENARLHQTLSNNGKTPAKIPLPPALQNAAQLPIGVDSRGAHINSMPLLSPLAESPLPPVHALVVDDDSLTRKLMTRMLTRLGHKVTTAEDGLQALSLFRQAWMDRDEGRYGICFLDNQMPACTGVECVREVRRIGLRTFVVGVTGNALLSDQQEYLEAGADVILTKPALERHIRDAIVTARARMDQIAASREAENKAPLFRPKTAPNPTRELP